MAAANAPRPRSRRNLADIGAGILDQLGLAAAHVLGASFGGAVAPAPPFLLGSRPLVAALPVQRVRRAGPDRVDGARAALADRPLVSRPRDGT